jgi:hypothetical protein
MPKAARYIHNIRSFIFSSHMMVSYLDMAMVAIVLVIAVEYPVFNRVANVGCRRGGGSAQKNSHLPK